MEKKMYEMISVLADCQAACNFCFHSCLEEAEVKMMARCIMLDRDCSEICGLTISMVASESEFATKALELCIAACDECARECRKHRYDHCEKCAEACEKCSEACREYLS